MKYTIPLIGLSLISSVFAGPVKGTTNVGYCDPMSDFRTLLELTARLEDKKVVVASEDDLKHVTSLVLPAPVSFDTARKAIRALLLLEGFELREVGNEVHLHRILSDRQCNALNEALGRQRKDSVEKLPRRRVASGRDVPLELVIIRPEIAKEAEQDGTDQPATQPADKPPVKDQPSTPTSKDRPR